MYFQLRLFASHGSRTGLFSSMGHDKKVCVDLLFVIECVLYIHACLRVTKSGGYVLSSDTSGNDRAPISIRCGFIVLVPFSSKTSRQSPNRFTPFNTHFNLHDQPPESTIPSHTASRAEPPVRFARNSSKPSLTYSASFSLLHLWRIRPCRHAHCLVF